MGNFKMGLDLPTDPRRVSITEKYIHDEGLLQFYYELMLA
jgi:hypothetical protein